jgi:hypothetical protein
MLAPRSGGTAFILFTQGIVRLILCWLQGSPHRYAKKTPDQKKRAKENHQIRDQKIKTELKHKTADEVKQIELKRKNAKRDLEREITDLQSIVTTMQHPVRGSVQYCLLLVFLLLSWGKIRSYFSVAFCI